MNMFISDYAIFLGKEEEGFITEFLVGDNFYFVFEIKNSVSKEDIRAMLRKIKDEIQLKERKTLSDFKMIIDQEVEKIVKEESFSAAAGLLTDDIFYILTLGEGEIYLKRENRTERIIAGGNSASGYIKDGDFFIFVSKNFSLLIDKQELNQQLNNRSPKDIVEDLTPKLKEKEDVGAIALFVKFHQQEINETIVAESPTLEEKPIIFAGWRAVDRIRQSIFHYYDKLNFNKNQIAGRKKLTFLAVVVLFLILLWSVGFGYQRRTQSQLAKKVKTYQEKINQKLNEAADLSTINLQRSMILLSEAKKDFGELKKIVGRKEIEEIKNLDQLISTKEKEIVKKEEKKYEEFYDLGLINKKAQGTKMYLDRETTAVLNSNSSEIYTLSLTKKSTRTINGSEIKKASLVAFYNDEIFFYNQEKGIFKIGQDDKINLVVKKDDDWGDLIDFWIFNGNLYFLDKTKDEIYKYLVAEGGYSNKTSYFKSGQSIDLAEANSIAIDASLYIGTNNNIYKYTAGVRDEFKIDLPEKDGRSFTKVFTDKNSNKIYLWEKNKGRIYILSKDGEYERQIDSSIFSKASDFVVLESEKNIYVLVKEKIYKVGLE